MVSVRSRRRLSAISSRSTSGRAPFQPPFVATTHPSGLGPRAVPIVSSLCPPAYVWAVSTSCTPAATASLMSSTCSGVFESRFVPSPIRATSLSPSLSLVIAPRGCIAAALAGKQLACPKTLSCEMCSGGAGRARRRGCRAMVRERGRGPWDEGRGPPGRAHDEGGPLRAGARPARGAGRGAPHSPRDPERGGDLRDLGEDSAAAQAVSAVVPSGFWNMNPALVTVAVAPREQGTRVRIGAYAL